MKKIILLALTTLMTAGCEQSEKPKYKQYYTENCIVAIIDSCEYIVNEEKYAFAYTDGIYKTYTHKGNCRFCKERKQKELEELIIKLKEK